MEINCPQCSQKLRVPDGLKNPLLRCKSCATKFRLDAALAGMREEEDTWPTPVQPSVAAAWPTLDVASTDRLNTQRASEASYPTIEVVDENPYSTVEQDPVPVSGDSNKSLASGLGTVALIVVVILMKGGPRLAKHFLRDRPQQQPPPVQMDQDHAQEFRRMRQEVEQRMAKQKLEQERQVEAPPN